MKSMLMLLAGTLALTVAGFPISPSFTPEAVKEYKVKADAGDAEAQYLYSTALIDGLGVARDRTNAFVYAKRAADQGYERALRLVGLGHERGWGVATNPDKAVECFTQFVAWAAKAGEEGDANASCQLGTMYFTGKCVKKNLTEGVRCYRKAAEQGDADAQRWLGNCYADGEGVEKDMVEAVKWYRKVAEQGDADEQWRLGCCYANGDGVVKDKVEAVKWWRKAAEQGNAVATWLLGCCYAKGEGVEKDMVEAVKWFRKAAEQGERMAQVALGWCYEKGEGVAKDADEADRWYAKSAGGKVARLEIRHGKELMSLCILGAIGLFAFVMFMESYAPAKAIGVLKSRRSSSYLILMIISYSIFAVMMIGLAVFLLYIVPSQLDKAKFAFGFWEKAKDINLYLSAMGWVSVASGVYLAVLAFQNWSRRGAVVGKIDVSFAQYAKVVVIGIVANIVLYLTFVVGFALVGCYAYATLVLLALVAFAFCLRPTRKKFAKLMRAQDGSAQEN